MISCGRKEGTTFMLGGKSHKIHRKSCKAKSTLHIGKLSRYFLLRKIQLWSLGILFWISNYDKQIPNWHSIDRFNLHFIISLYLY